MTPMFTYRQRSGELLREGVVVGTGYSGRELGKNNPSFQGVKNTGPIPRGLWHIVGPPFTGHGPYVLRLVPGNNTETFDRSGFLIHGDSLQKPGTASQGCIVLPRHVRELVWASGGKELEVVE